MALKSKLFETYKLIVKTPTSSLPKVMEKFLKQFYTSVVTNETYDYIMAEGNIPIGIVAHMDTVFPHPPKDIYYDRKEDVVWSPQGGIGDDRVGIFLIYNLLVNGYKPHIFLMNDEEYGGLGAQELVKDYLICPFYINYLIELDRQGNNEAVFYNCNNPNFTNYILSFGFKETHGIFSDISIICPYWGVAGVNLSVGYHNEHSLLETWHPKEAMNTYNKVIKMFEDKEHWQYFKYLPDLQKIPCDCCGQEFYDIDLFKTVMEDGSINYLCPQCIADKNISWCPNCGLAFTTNEKLCPRCINVEFSEIEI